MSKYEYYLNQVLTNHLESRTLPLKIEWLFKHLLRIGDEDTCTRIDEVLEDLGVVNEEGRDEEELFHIFKPVCYMIEQDWLNIMEGLSFDIAHGIHERGK